MSKSRCHGWALTALVHRSMLGTHAGRATEQQRATSADVGCSVLSDCRAIRRECASPMGITDTPKVVLCRQALGSGPPRGTPESDLSSQTALAGYSLVVLARSISISLGRKCRVLSLKFFCAVKMPVSQEDAVGKTWEATQLVSGINATCNELRRISVTGECCPANLGPPPTTRRPS